MAEKDWMVIQVPYGGGYSSLNLAHTPNTRRAPKALQKEFARQRVFMADNGVSSWDNVAWLKVKLGYESQNSLDGWNNMDKSVFELIFDVYRDCVSRGSHAGQFLFLGGSHSITASTYAAIAQINRKKRLIESTGLILLDAHPDCCSKSNWPIHSDWLRWLIEYEYVLPENVLIIGLRQMEKSEKEFLEKHNIAHCCMDYLRRLSYFSMINHSTFFVLERFRKLAATYLSIDIDVASGVYAPGTGCPSLGGFADTELINMVKQLKVALPNLRAADIVEINPLNWWQKRVLRYDATVDLGVKLIKEIIS